MKMPMRSNKGEAAFSLVEVVISLAVVGAILVPIICLTALALSNTQDETFRTGAGCVLSLITSDVRSVPKHASKTQLYSIQLPLAGAATSPDPTRIYVDSDYNITASVSDARFQINYWATGPGPGHPESTVRVLISWPAAATYANAQGTVETIIVINRIP